MPEYKDYFLKLEDVEKHNSFIGRKPNMADLPDFESNKSKLPEPVWDGHADSIEPTTRRGKSHSRISASRPRRTALFHRTLTPHLTATSFFGTVASC